MPRSWKRFRCNPDRLPQQLASRVACRAAYYEQADFAHEYSSRKCLVKLGYRGPTINCNVFEQQMIDMSRMWVSRRRIRGFGVSSIEQLSDRKSIGPVWPIIQAHVLEQSFKR
jgi:hypothetical protein